jgi:hypothetical protein
MYAEQRPDAKTKCLTIADVLLVGVDLRECNWINTASAGACTGVHLLRKVHQVL